MMVTCCASDIVFLVSNWRNEGEPTSTMKRVAATLCTVAAVLIAVIETVVYTILAFLACNLKRFFDYGAPFHYTCELLYDATLTLRQVGRAFSSNFTQEKMVFLSRHPWLLWKIPEVVAPENEEDFNGEVSPRVAYAVSVCQEGIALAPGKSVDFEALEEKVRNPSPPDTAPEAEELLTFFDEVKEHLLASNNPDRINGFLKELNDFETARASIQRYVDLCSAFQYGVQDLHLKSAIHFLLLGLVLLLRQGSESKKYEIISDLMILPIGACDAAVFDRVRELYERHSSTDLDAVDERLKSILQTIKRDCLDSCVNANVHNRNDARILLAERLGLDVTVELSDPHRQPDGNVGLEHGRVGAEKLWEIFQRAYTSELIIYEVKVVLNQLFKYESNDHFRRQILLIIYQRLQNEGLFNDVNYEEWVPGDDPTVKILNPYIGTLRDEEGKDLTHYITDAGVALALVHCGFLTERV